ncbi:hypothetical protein HYH03_014056 [Edaphochlamys debaryana]|uniref:PAS domain-containing protein n=1 Tax=Edaphochlamys debaryana TaxID=47281 RepID=A0A835XUY1_9CHLO|nr:hypothetical protein HYH03_014056 [Edaphochlamys debaryana]|eukprot:KAG2487340.1 hypothetical protein HYH03_014056 [Edaphochlamys debaryana]
MSEHGDTSSQRSGNSGTSGGNSETSSQRSDSKFLVKRSLGVKGGNDETSDLEQKRNIQDGVFACMYTLVRQSAMTHWKYAALKLFLEFACSVIVVCNPTVAKWQIDVEHPLWKIFRWVIWRAPIARMYGYDLYARVLYVMVVIVWLAVAGLIWLTLAMRKQEQSKWLRKAAIALHVVYELVFVFFYMAFFDYLTFFADCRFGTTNTHAYWPTVDCLAMPHLIHMFVAMTTAVLFLAVTALMIIASSDLNPVSQGYLASPAVYSRLRILAAKAAVVIFANCVDSQPKAQAIGIALAVGLVCWWNLRDMPFYRSTVTCIMVGIWCGVLYPAVLLFVMVFGKNQSYEFQRAMTENVLRGIFPVTFGGMGLAYLYVRWAMRPAAKFLNLQPGVKIARIHKFESVFEVEHLSRVMRVFDIDNNTDEEAAAHGETIIKAGIQTYPNKPFLLILYANFVLEVKKDGPASRTQLQLASKASPNMVERYQVFCTSEASKRLKDSQEGGMDLQAYIEFKRNFRRAGLVRCWAVLRVHKEVLLMQADLWRLCLRTSLKVSLMDSTLEALEAATARANQVYKRLLERYPTNGKLLRCYGKFLEDVKHDQVAAGRAYVEANRNGGGSALLALDMSSTSGKPDFITSMSLEDDAVIVIDASGTIMMVSQAVQSTFGYAKAEIEGGNVSVLMPQPFSQRHPGYLQRYVSTGEAHMLDIVREVVVLHKDRYVFPVALCVTKLSGIGEDSVFMGVVKPLPPSRLTVRAWLAPNGTCLCADQQFSSMVGWQEGELVGRSLAAICTEPDAVEHLLQRCREASASDLEGGAVAAGLVLLHRYLDPVPITATVSLAGTDGQRILTLNCLRTDGQDGSVLVCDTHMRIRFASVELAMTLGYSMKKLATMRLEDLMPPPWGTLHAKWLKDPPHNEKPTSCRGGAIVNLVTEAGVQVPVRLAMKTAELDTMGTSHATTVYVVRVSRVAPEAVLDDTRVVLIVAFTGRVLSASPPESTILGFPASQLHGFRLQDCVDLFADWQARTDTEPQLLLLALQAKEQDLPGCTWRVRISAPDEGVSLPPIDGKPGTQPKKRSVLVCLQVELDESLIESAAGDGTGADGPDDAASNRLRISLWRRDLLGGMVEIDEDLVVHKASPPTGFITGVPPSAMIKKSLHRFLDIPAHVQSWDALLAACTQGSGEGAHKHKKSALKGTAERGVISPVLALVGPHPDSGQMRLLLQGVQTVGPRGRPRITLSVHPDTTYVGAHANIMRALRLDTSRAGSSTGGSGGGVSHAGAEESRPASRPASAAVQRGRTRKGGMGMGMGLMEGADAAAAADALAHHESGGEGGDDSGSGKGEGEGDGDLPERDDGSEGSGGEEPGRSIHHQTATKSEFVEQWVRTVSRIHGPDPAAADGAPGGDAAGADLVRSKSCLVAIPEAEEQGEGERGGVKFGASVKGGSVWSETGPDGGGGGGDGKGGRAGGGKERDDDRDSAEASDDNSSAQDGSEAASASALSSITDQSASTDVAVLDSRRGRLLKALNRTLLGPSLLEHVDRLRRHSYGVIAIMFITHVIAYVCVTQLIKVEHDHVYDVHRQALAMDRCQLLTARAMTGAFCARANVTEKVGVCASSTNYTVTRIAINANLMEENHQAVYLGVQSSQVQKQKDLTLYHWWTTPTLDYQFFTDTQTPQVIALRGGVWHLGNRFIAACREMVYLLPAMQENFRNHRLFQFILATGLGPMFEGYSTSLDYMVSFAWSSIGRLRRDLIVLLVVEALIVQMLCTAYELWLVQRAENARVVGMLAMLGLPGPILRQMSTATVKIVNDSDDESDAGSMAGDEDPAQQNGGGGGGGGGGRGSAEHSESGKIVAAGAADGALAANADGAAAVGAFAGGAARVSGSSMTDSSDGGGNEHARKHLHVKKRSGSGGAAAAGAGSGGGALFHGSRKRDGEAHGSKAHHRASRLRINGKQLLPSYWNASKFMAPFVLWNLAVIIVYILTLMKLQGMQGPLALLNMASRVTYRYTRIRAIALAFVTQDTPDMRATLRDPLATEVDLFEGDYNALMYGGIPASMEGSTFRRMVPPGTFASSSFAQSFFRSKGCFRYDQSACFTPDSPFYEVTHNGLDPMVRRVITEMRLLTLDADVDVAYNNSRYMFMALVGANDVYEGLEQGAQLFVDYSISRYDQVTQLHTILLVISVGLVLGFVLLLLWPHGKRVLRDCARQSALLSLVPPEMDVRAHVRGVAKRMANGGARPAGRDRVAGEPVAVPAAAGGAAEEGGPPGMGMELALPVP